MAQATPISVTVDVMGGDHAPDVVLDGITMALANDDALHLVACGPRSIVEPLAASNDRITALEAEEVIGMDEHPMQAVSSKKHSSIVVGAESVAQGIADGFFSAGSTGAVSLAAIMKIGRIKGARPATAQIIPAYKKPTLLLDVGANAVCKPSYLYQFALMGSVYMEQLFGVTNPTCALLNIGEEETKGNTLAIETYELLSEKLPNFVGNAEGRDITSGDYDVIVTDGFTGNVVLKTIEGVASTIFLYVKDILKGSLKNKLAAAVIKGDLSSLKATLSPDTYGGAPLLGVKGAVIIGHGSSNAKAISQGIAVCAQTARADVANRIAEALGRSDG